MKTCAVAYAGWNGDHRAGHQSAHYARKRAFHSGANHNHTSLGEALAIAHQAMDAGHPDIVNRLDMVAHHFRGDLPFLRDWDVAGACGHDRDCAFAFNCAVAPKADSSG